MKNLQAANAPGLFASLAVIVPDLQRFAQDRWMLIGSAAAWLSGAEVTIADIDIFTSQKDAACLMNSWEAYRDRDHVPPDAHRFRSHFARFTFRPMPVEIMGGLELYGKDGWNAVTIKNTVRVDRYGVDVCIPSLDEQIRLLESFARPKDLARAMALKSLQQESS